MSLESIRDLSDLLAALGFFINGGGLLSCVLRRPSIPYRSVFLLFAAFLAVCGSLLALGAFVERPEPGLAQTVLRVLLALVSLAAAAALVPRLPSISGLRAPEELALTHARLEAEAQERRRVEEQLRLTNASLEERIRLRVHEADEARLRAEAYLRELGRQKDELSASNAELEQFAYAASHDLKAPLRAIDNLSQWIAEDLGDDSSPAVKEHLTLMRQRVRRMSRLLDDLLAYSRVGRQQHATEPINLAEMLRDLIESLRPARPGFSFEVQAELRPFEGAAVPLRQVLQNLISNAMKHHDRDDGCISIQAVDKGSTVCITVADDGPGIEPRFHERIFQVFQTLKPRDQVEGSGIGLALVRKILDVHGGSVRVDSDLKRGASFEVTWPKAGKDGHGAD